MKWLYSKWWKWLSVVLLMYVVVGSFMVPLGPGITKVEPITFSPDSVYTFKISAHSAHFKNPSAGKIQLWFKAGNDYFCPSASNIIDNKTLEARFGVSALQQNTLKSVNFDVVVNDNVDGTFALRECVTLIKNNNTSGDSSLTLNQCPVEVVHNKHQFMAFPYREILYESMRNTFFHVPMWFVMTLLAMFSFVYSVLYLMRGKKEDDIFAHQAVVVALLFGLCGYTTGMIWSKYTWFIGLSWGAAIRNMVAQDIKLAGALIGIAAYLAYLVLRSSITDEIKRARISAVYNVFALVIFMLFIFIMPRLTDSLHPGNGGNPAFSKYDLDNTMRMFFYPAVIGWILLGFWLLSIRIRLQLIQQKQES